MKYNYFSTQSPNTLMHLSDLGMNLKTSSWYKNSSCICNYSWTVLLWNQQLPKVQHQWPKCTPACFVQRVMCWAHFSLHINSLIS